MLSSLEVLSLCDIILPKISFVELLTVAGHAVSRLDIDFCCFDDFAHFEGLVLSLRGLQSLSLKFLTFMNGATATVADNARKAALSSVMLSRLHIEEHPLQPWIVPLTTWLHTTSTSTSLQKLYLRPAMNQRLQVVQNMIQLARHTLDTLVLHREDAKLFDAGTWNLFSLPLRRFDSISSGTLNFIGSIALRKLCLKIPVTCIQQCPDFLATFTTGGLVDLFFIFADVIFGDDDPWSNFTHIALLDDVLSRPQFASLQRFSIECRVYRKDPDLFDPELLECRDRVLEDWLPHVDPKIWVDDFGDTFDI